MSVSRAKHRQAQERINQAASLAKSLAKPVGGWIANTSTAQWITAPGGATAGSASLPGNGTSGTNSAYYVYRLAFNISGSGAAG